MNRISSDMANTDIQFFLRRQEDSVQKLQNQISSGNRITRLRDDPLAASRTVRYDSYLARLDRFEKNTAYAKDHLNQIDLNLRSSVDILQRVRELAVMGANGTYTQEDTRNMATEVNVLLQELVSIANAVGPDTKQLFAGDKSFTEPFRIVEGTVDGGGETLVVNVEYRGAGASRKTEIHNNIYTDLDIGGGEAFGRSGCRFIPLLMLPIGAPLKMARSLWMDRRSP